MYNRNALLILFTGGGTIWLRRFLAEQACAYYKPLWEDRLDRSRLYNWLSSGFLGLGVLVVLLGLFLLRYGEKSAAPFVTNTLLAAIVVISGLLYLFWSIPGWYRWKKTGKGIELALFVTKLSIGILTIMGVVLGYVLGKI